MRQNVPVQAFGRYTRGDPEETPQNLFIKTCVFFHVETSATFRVLSIRCSAPVEAFSAARRSNASVLMPLMLLPFFVHLFLIGKTFPFEDFFHPGRQ